MAINYTNVTFAQGYDIAERYRAADGTPVLLRFAWFSYVEGAERYMRAHDKEFPSVARNRRIINCQTGAIVPWRGIAGKGENALSFDEWSSFADETAAT